MKVFLVLQIGRESSGTGRIYQHLGRSRKRRLRGAAILGVSFVYEGGGY